MLHKKLEIVHWRDANFIAIPDENFDVEEDYINATVGWVEEKGRWLVIVSEITPGGERAVTRVPTENIVSRNRLKVRKPKPPKSPST